MASQGMLALHAYNSNTGVVVDVGEKIEVLPIINGGWVWAGEVGGGVVCCVLIGGEKEWLWGF